MRRTNADIFKSSVFDLPKYRKGEGIEEFINDIFVEYINEILKFNGELRKIIRPKVSFIESQIKKVKQSLSLYLQGFPSAAYIELSNALSLLVEEDYLPIQKTELASSNSQFYRVRISNNKTLTREDLFHIPFELREKVSTQRYSIPGLPCLYLADSIFVCWEELSRPNIDDFYVSRIDLSQSKLKFLYFNTSTDEIRKQCFSNKNKDGKLLNLLVPFLCYWPILAACSVIVRKPHEIFKPEYIIPQLLLQWVVSEQRVDGIIYKSNRINGSNHNVGTFKNVVIPVKEIQSKGFCPELKKKIKLTAPLSYQLLEMSGKKSTERAIEPLDLHRAMYVELINGEKAVYSETVFGKLENKLASLPTVNIQTTPVTSMR